MTPTDDTKVGQLGGESTVQCLQTEEFAVNFIPCLVVQ